MGDPGASQSECRQGERQRFLSDRRRASLLRAGGGGVDSPSPAPLFFFLGESSPPESISWQLTRKDFSEARGRSIESLVCFVNLKNTEQKAGEI